MSDMVKFAEIDGQHVELLPARTLLQTLGNAVVGDVDGDGDVDRDDTRLARDIGDRNGDGVIDTRDATFGTQGGVGADLISGIGVLGSSTASSGAG